MLEPSTLETSALDLSKPQADPLQEAMDVIANLEQAVRQKDQALLKSTAAAAELEKQLADSQDESERLKKRLVAVVKASEMLAAKVPAATQDQNTGERMVPETEVLRMKEQWRSTQKTMEKEQDRLRSELVKTSAAWQRTNHQLEIQTRAYSVDKDRSLSKVTALERQVASASATAASQSAQKGRGMWIKLSAASAATAVVMLLVGLWMQFSPAPHVNSKPEVTPLHAVSAVLSSTPPTESPFVSHGQFQRSLSRLNESLSVAGSASPEQLLRAVRKANAKTDPGVCDIQWNNGQPALTFGGGSLSMESSLDRCATAVNRYLKNQ